MLKKKLMYMFFFFEIHPKMIMIWTYENMAHFRPFKSPLLCIWCICVANFFDRCLFFQVENLNLATNLKIIVFMPC